MNKGKLQRNIFLLCSGLVVLLLLGSVFSRAQAAFNPTINYQGKLTDDAGATVADGTYNIRFWLLSSPSIATTSALWSESLTGTNKVQVTNGLFSVMLGSTTPLTSVDFDQTLYLGVEIGGTGSPSWDGEMSPRKILGTVPAAFEAQHADDTSTLGGVASTSFLRSDQADTASGLLTFTGGIISNSSSTITSLTTITATTTNLVVNGERFTDLTGTGLQNNSGVLTLNTTYLDTLYASSTDFDTSAELAAILSDETGTAGSVVFSASPTFTGTVQAASENLSGTLTFSGTSGQIVKSGSATGQLDIDFPDATSTSQNLRIFRNTNTTGNRFFTIYKGDGSSTAVLQVTATSGALTINGQTSDDNLLRLRGISAPGERATMLFQNHAGTQTYGTISAHDENDPAHLPTNHISIETVMADLTTTKTRFGILWGVDQSTVQISNADLNLDSNSIFDIGNTSSYLSSTTWQMSGANSTNGSALLVSNTTNSAVDAPAIIEARVGGNTTTGDPKLLLSMSGGNTWHVGVDNSASDLFEIGTSTTVGNSSSKFLTISTAGVVTVAKNGGSLALGDGTNTSANFSVSGGRTYFGYNGANAVVQGGASKGILFNVNNASFGSGTAAILTSGGNFGIATTTPSQKLTVVGNAYITGALYDSNNSAGSNGYVLQSTGTGFNWVATSTLGFGTGTVTGTGSSGRVAYWSGASALTSDSTFTFANSKLTAPTFNASGASTTVLAFNGQQLLSASSTYFSTFLGLDAGVSNGIGANASFNEGFYNTGIGYQALMSNTEGLALVAVGHKALTMNTTGSANIAVGSFVLDGNTTGSNNIGIGHSALGTNISGTDNVAVGGEALYENGFGIGNTAIGRYALYNTDGVYNVALGYGAGFSVTSGYANILLGTHVSTANVITSGDGNIGLGNELYFPSATSNNQLNIGNFLFGTLPATSTNFAGVTTNMSQGRLGIGTSTPSQHLTVAGNLRVTGSIYDSANSAGSNGMVLQSTGTGFQWVATSTLGFGTSNFTSADIDTCAELAAIMSGETGTCGSLVLSANPTFTGTVNAAAATLSGTLTLSGNTASRALFLDSSSRATTTAASAALLNTLTDETGTGVAVFATSPTLTTPNLGTPSAVTLTNATGLPVSTGISGLGTGVATFLATPSSANLASAVTGETGSGALVFGTSPTFTTQITTPLIQIDTNTTGVSLDTDADGMLIIAGTGNGNDEDLRFNFDDAAGGANVVDVTSGTGVTTVNYSSIALQESGSAVLSVGDLDTCAEFAALGAIETGTCGSLVLSASPTFTGTVNAAALTLSSTLTLSGNTASRALFLDSSSRATTTAASAALANTLTDETGSGALVFGTSPTLTTPNLGTPSAVTLTSGTGLPISTGLTGAGTGVLTALGVNVGTAGSLVVNGGALGTPSSGTLTNATGLPISTGISGLAAGIATWLGTPSSANLISAVTDETGTGALVFGTSPTLSAPTFTGKTTLANATTTNLTITGKLFDGSNSAGSNGYVLKSTGTGSTWVATSTLGFLANTSIDTCAELAAIMSGETGTCGSLVLSASPTFTGTVNAAALTLSSTLTLSGSSANIALGSNYLSGDGGDEGVFVSSTGNVGIGTSTPSTKLTVVGDGYFSSNLTIASTSQALTLGDGSNTSTYMNISGGRTLIGYNGANAVLQAGVGKNILFNVNNASFGSGTAAILTSGGNFGIATTTPSQKLTVVGNAYITGALYDSNNSTGSNGYVLQSSGTGQHWVATSTLGFGTGSLSSTDIDTCAELAAIVSGETGTCGSLVLSASPTFTGTVNAAAATLSSTLTMSGTAANIALGSNYLSGDGGDEGVFVSSTGRVGIGTSTPTNELTVAGNFDVKATTTGGKGYRFRTSGNALDFEGGGASLYLSVFADADYSGVQHTYSRYGYDGDYVDNWNYWDWLNSSDQPVLIIDPNDQFVWNEQGESSLDARFEGDTNPNLLFVDASTDRIGIGTSTPNQALSIFRSAADAAIEFSTVSGANEKWTIGIDDSDGAKFKISSSSALGTNDRLVINGAGYVGIGTSSPSSKLYVNGGNITQVAYGNPTLKGTLNTSGDSYDVAISGKYAYVADFGSGLQIIDISNPASPTLEGTYSTVGNALNVVVSGKYAYVVDGSSGLQIIDVSNPTSPTLVGTYNTSGSAESLTVSGKYAYVADSGSGLQIIDVSNPTSPTLVGTYNTSGSALGVAVSGKYAYVADSAAGLRVVDISNPAALALVGTYDTAGNAFDVDISGKYAYVSDLASGLQIIDISNPASPTFVGTYNTSGSAESLTVSGKYAYVADSGSGLQVIDISNPASPTLVGTYDTTGTGYGVAVSGKYAYVADATSGLQILDINGAEFPSLYAGNIEADQLNVNQNIVAGGDIYTQGGLNVGISGIFSRGTISAFVASTTQTNAMVANLMGGNVGIGTTTSNQKLAIFNNGADAAILFGTVAGANEKWTVGIDDSDGAKFKISSSSALGTNDRLVINGAGYVGIGDSTPDMLLDVEGSTAGNYLSNISNNSATGYGQYIFVNNALTTTHALGIDNSGGAIFRVRSDGNVGIGTTTPSSKLAMQKTGMTGSGIAGIHQYFTFTNSTASAVYYGDNTYIVNAPTATSTLVGKMLKIEDSTTKGNTVRGLEVQAHKGTNTQGENTGLSGFGRTFGVRGTTEGDAGGVFQPAGVFAQTRGTTQGNAIRAYSASITTEDLVSLFQDTSAFAGTGLVMNFGNSGGSFSSTTSKFVDFQNAGVSNFTVGAHGMTTIGDGTTNNNAGLQIGYGGLCVDNDGTCTASTTGKITSVSSSVGHSDLAEMYFSSEKLEPGEIVYSQGVLSVGKANEETEELILGVVSTNPGLTLGFDDESLIGGQKGYPIALSGRVPIKLSTENGPIKKGDKIALSSIPGVGMKATDSSTVVGVALEDFDGEYAYSEGFVVQFGDNIAEPDNTPDAVDDDTRINDGCYFGGGAELGTKPCKPRDAQRFATIARETNDESTQMQEALMELADDEPERETTPDGTEVKIGQALMFVNLGQYQNINEHTMLAELVSTSTDLVLGGDGEETLWSRLKELAQNFVGGVLQIAGLRAENVYVENELCVDGVCVTADDLRALLQEANRPETGSGTGETTHQPQEEDTQAGGDTATSTDPQQVTDTNETASSTESGTTENPPEEVPTQEEPELETPPEQEEPESEPPQTQEVTEEPPQEEPPVEEPQVEQTQTPEPSPTV